MPKSDQAEKIPQLATTALDQLRADVRAGHACIATFEGPRGTAFVEVLGPKGMRPDGDHLVAAVSTLRLWVPERGAPEVTAVANTDFDKGLRAIEEAAKPHLHPPEVVLLASVLAVVRDAAKTRRPRIPTIGASLTEAGTPSLRGWASCVPLGVLEAAVRKAAA